MIPGDQSLTAAICVSVPAEPLQVKCVMSCAAGFTQSDLPGRRWTEQVALPTHTQGAHQHRVCRAHVCAGGGRRGNVPPRSSEGLRSFVLCRRDMSVARTLRPAIHAVRVCQQRPSPSAERIGGPGRLSIAKSRTGPKHPHTGCVRDEVHWPAAARRRGEPHGRVSLERASNARPPRVRRPQQTMCLGYSRIAMSIARQGITKLSAGAESFVVAANLHSLRTAGWRIHAGA
jgi:hypothetical protein